MQKDQFNKAVFTLIGVSAFIRAFLAWSLELGNDEVYYWTYALYPDLSHFDHPPMVGWIIQFFSLNLLLDSELFLRMGSIILGSFNTWLIFIIGKKLKDVQTGFYAALLYTSSVYGFIITGVFILPDTPQMFFWLLSIYFITNSIFNKEISSNRKLNLIWVGVFTGLGMLSKYTSIYVWVGLIAYILFFDRRWLKTSTLYISILISIFIFSPVIWWNIQNDFISFSFQGERVNILSSSLRFDFFLMEILGEFLYNNPINVILIALALVAFFRKRVYMETNYFRLLLLTSLPLILTFILFSFFRRTLPHWTAPAYTTLLIIAAAYIRDKTIHVKTRVLIPIQIKTSLYLLAIVVIIGFVQIKAGIINFYDPDQTDPTELGEKDISLDIVGWKQIGNEFSLILKRDLNEGNISSSPFLTTYRWFPAANLDYYAATPNNIQMLAIGPIQDIHKYYWINQYRGGFQLGRDAYYITTSRDFHDPKHVYARFFERIEPTDTIQVNRGGKHVMNAFVYRLKNMDKLPN